MLSGLYVDVPEGLHPKLTGHWEVEAAGGELSPLRFEAEDTERKTLAQLRERVGMTKGDRELVATEAGGRSDLVTVNRNGTWVTSLTFLPLGPHGWGVLCFGSTRRQGGWDDVQAVAKFLLVVCGSFRTSP
jgi:hypothetical protein